MKIRRGLLVGIALLCTLTGAARAQSGATMGQPLPSLALPDVVTGQVRAVRELMAGRVGALIFMQTSCGVCKTELRAFEAFARTYGDKLMVVAVSVDSGNPARVAGYKKREGFPFVFLHDPEFETPERFGFFFTPGLVMVGPDGTIEWIKSGFRADDKSQIDAIIARLTSKADAGKAETR